MPVRPEESLEKMVASLGEKTGKTLDEWKAIVSAKGLVKHGEIMSLLKGEYGVSHGYANQIALRCKPEPAAEEAKDPIEGIFAKKEEAKELYDLLITKIMTFGPDVDLGPKKAYVSVRRSKQFAILQPAASRLDVGIHLPGTEPAGRLEASGSFNAMLSHRVKVSEPIAIDDELIGWLRAAYDRA
jgi:hypothetical protein